MKKQEFVDLVCEHIIEKQKNNKTEYRDIQQWIIHNSMFKDFLSNKKDILNYIHVVLRSDTLLLKRLTEIYGNAVTRHRNGYFDFDPDLEDTSKEKNTQKIDNIIAKLDLSNLKQYYCPYNQTIKECKQASRNKYRKSLTNEPIFNEYLQGFRDIIGFNNVLHSSYNLDFEYNSDKIVIFQKQHYKGVCVVEYGDNFIRTNITDSILLDYVKGIKKIYPFNHFKLMETILSFYLLFITTNSGKDSLIKYLTFLNIEVTKNTMVKKYFDQYTINKTYQSFYHERLDDLVYRESNTVNTFYGHLLKMKDNKFTGFIVGYYKLFHYMKNLFNREVKKCATDYYHLKAKSIKFINVTDYKGFHSIGY
jgi:hypothetical protein